MTEPVKPWATLGYEQVPGLANRLISRYLRTQRKAMLRFFTERGTCDLTERMQQIRRSRQGMLAKNRMFQKVLNEYTARLTVDGTPTQPAAEAAPRADSRDGDMGVSNPRFATGGLGLGLNDGGGVLEVAVPDGAARLVIEE